MSIPDFQTIMLPLLKIIKESGPLSLREAVQKISETFQLTTEEQSQLLPSGKQEIIHNRVGWSKTYLAKAGLIRTPQRGVFEITDRGSKVLLDNPTSINVKFLLQFPEFKNFRSQRKVENEDSATEDVLQTVTPEEQLEDSYLELKNNLLDDMLEKIKSCSPKFFEDLVVDTIVAMGYGGSRKEAGKAIGQSGDEGIDGIINEDRLGLDVIYLQAKRWEANIGRPEIQKFAGALQGKRAKKGIFITTSDFTNEAKEFVRNIEAKIILISGEQLVELMWEFNLGVTSAAIYEVKKMDYDFFIES